MSTQIDSKESTIKTIAEIVNNLITAYEKNQPINLTKLKTNIESYLQDYIYRVVINDLNYLRPSKSFIISFQVILDPRLNDFNKATSLLNQFNYLIINKIGFNEIKILNETKSNSSLLPSLSKFSSESTKKFYNSLLIN